MAAVSPEVISLSHFLNASARFPVYQIRTLPKFTETDPDIKKSDAMKMCKLEKTNMRLEK